jgi:hypothetical protein
MIIVILFIIIGISLCSVLRERVVKIISKTLTLPGSEIPLCPFTIDNVNIKVCCSLHPLGLGEDREDQNRSMTVTSAIHLPRETHTNKITLSVSTYDGEKPIGHSRASREITDEDRRNRRLHMIIHQVARQEDIVLKVASPKIGFKIKFKIEAG